MTLAVSLQGIRVIDLSHLLPGPYCCRLLADLGADVIKVEAPGLGDGARWMPPLSEGRSHAFELINRGKRSVALNLKAERGRELLLELAGTADVLVDGYRPGVLDRLGVGWPVLHARHPRLVVCAITGYGQRGPSSRRPGHDINYLARTGILALNRPAGGEPHPLPVTLADLAGGAQAAAVEILAALVAAGRGGEGVFIDISMTDRSREALDAIGGEWGARYLSGAYACYGVYRCADGHLSVGALEPRFWATLCEELGRPDLVPLQFEEGEQERVRAELAAIFATAGRDAWERRLGRLDVCVEPLRTPEEARPPAPAAGHAPQLGADSDEVLGELGLDPAEIAKLRAAGII
ncbi:MAG TPA: CaiB/BaiF CoA-transferase family protein [Candidatus Dormibacteraeota bacterium]|jgi:crotonobetainyl-CoA:carnitine CoA-transferase CaiB-like acyl-CoA transferase|nr:CaiB/BaiF CoA-transferase family protein [Candidatus Dormibacteraeota bacterium]